MLRRRLWGSFPRKSSACRISISSPRYAQHLRWGSDYLLRAVETDETQRLDIQHRMNLHMMHQTMLHPSIPRDLERVADVATGNGTWLFDLIKYRNENSGSTSPKTKYHGFDISPSLFPKPETLSDLNIDLSLHDFYKPFPEEHVGKYDLVHARHLSLTVQGAADLALAMKNITSLLKPGGYLQMEEYDYETHIRNCPPAMMTSTWAAIFDWIRDSGYSLKFPDDVYNELRMQGLDVIEKKMFTTQGLPFCEDHRLTLLYAFYTGVPRMCWKAKGKSDEEVEAIIEECLEEWEQGVLTNYYLSRILSRKPTDVRA
ncbi:class I SAM-dependent methyltransferase [Aspergillus lucknowensis]|uniref:Methyltransferase domain-containing protein n=1 Tax=Aspergillus lucknowensis TaxID=176173 RepID=A0ABR4L8W6_9EURO